VGRVDFKKTNGNRPRRTPKRILQLESGRDEIDVEESSLQISKSNEKKREATDIVKRGKKSEKEWTGQV